MNKNERIKMVKAMEYIARQINNEDVFYNWLVLGVADGDIDYADISEYDDGTVSYYTDDERFAELMQTFLLCMKEAWKSGGLYCDGIVSKESD